MIETIHAYALVARNGKVILKEKLVPDKKAEQAQISYAIAVIKQLADILGKQKEGT